MLKRRSTAEQSAHTYAHQWPSKVYMTVLSNDKYVRGVKALKRSLRSVKSKYDLVVLIPEDKSDVLTELLKKARIPDAHCRVMTQPKMDVVYPSDVHFEQHYWEHTFFKLQVAKCDMFEKIVLLDSDMLIMRNIDDLFEKPHYSAVVAGGVRHPEWVTFNSGLMVLVPSNTLYRRLADCIAPAMERCYREACNIGDQDVFQEAFPDWPDHPELSLSETYNAFFEYVYDLRKKYPRNELRVVHFIGSTKPWSNGVITKENILRLYQTLRAREIWKFGILLKYLVFSL